jgi:hypothetical protein
MRSHAMKPSRTSSPRSTNGGPAPRDLRRAFRDELRRILRRASHHPDGADVHAVRKGITRLRSWLRLARDQIGLRRYRQHNRRLRKSARTLAPLRDARVMLATFEELDSAPSFPDTHQQLRKHARWAKKAMPVAMRKVKHRLAKEHEESRKLPLGRISAEQLAAGLKRLRGEMEAASEAARTAGSVELLHTWRKRAKNYLHALSFVEGTKRVRTRRLARLNQLLGADHDLALLETELAPTRDQPEARALLSVLAERRRKLRSILPGRATVASVRPAHRRGPGSGQRIYGEHVTAALKTAPNQRTSSP